MGAMNTIQYGRRQALFALCMAFLLGVPPAHADQAVEPEGLGEKAQALQVKGRPRLFGTIDFRRPLEKQQSWLSVLRRNAEAPIFKNENFLTRTTTWKDLKTRAQGKPLKVMLDVVNRFWNAWPYRADREVWGQDDFWAIPAEFLKRSGDCEDYCIAKYFTLRELGIPADDMRIVVVRETIRGIAHAVLAVYEGQQVHILDNLSEHVRPMQRVRNYLPYFSVNENGRWMHVKAKPMGSKHGTEK